MTEKQKLSEGFDWNKATEEEIHAYVEALEQELEFQKEYSEALLKQNKKLVEMLNNEK